MNIQFKSKNKVNLKGIFPVISEEDYNLLEGLKVKIEKRTLSEIEEKGYLEICGYQISKDLIEYTNGDIIAGETQQEIQALIDKEYVYSEKVVDILIAGVETGKNVLLWGPGGHGKSEITEKVLNELFDRGVLSSKPFVQAFGDGLTDEKLFGGMNIKKYKEEGVIEYLPENSFMNHEIVVFEEIFDAPPQTLLSLKDIMTSKKFRQGNEVFDIKTKLFIGLTNKSKDEFTDKDDSLKALAERFVLTLNVKWDHYNKKDFIHLFKTVFGETYYKTNKEKLTTLSNIAELNNAEGGSFISPRTLVAAADLFVRGKSLHYISDLDQDIIQKYKYQEANKEMNSNQNKLINRINAYIDEHNLKFIDEDEEFLRDLNMADQAIENQDLSIDDLDFGSQNDSQIKINKCDLLLNLINRQDPVRSTEKQLMDLKRDITSMKQKLTESLKQEA